jgi:hypothetical protein
MPNWRKGLIIGSFAAGALLMIKGHRPAGIAAATVGLAILAAEYPDKFEDIWEQAPDYVYKGTQIFATLSRLAERFAENASEHGLTDAFQDIRKEYAR